jgi:uncharacterized coiled-coil protein SlyX
MVPGSSRNWIAVNAVQQSILQQKNMTTLRLIKSMGRSPSRLALLLIPLVLGCIGLLPKAQAVSPPPPGGYPNFTTAAGDHALQALTLGVGNTAIGTFSLFSVTAGNFNTALGAGALDLNTADSNTATGAAALLFNTTGAENTANGTAALEFNDTGSQNTANGAFALFNNTTGDSNTANGASALNFNTTGNNNTANGVAALSSNTTGGANTALGAGAGNGVTTADTVTCIGANVVGANVSNTTWIASVYGVTTQSGTTAPVIVSDTGQLGTLVSSERFKKDIATMENASETILSLRPVTFHYKTDTKGTPQFGLIAEEVAKVNSALVLPDKEGKPYTVRYDAVNAMLLNEFLKEHRKVEAQERRLGGQEVTITELKLTIAQQQKAMETVTAQLKEQAAQIQKVSAQLEASRPAPQMVLNNP